MIPGGSGCGLNDGESMTPAAATSKVHRKVIFFIGLTYRLNDDCIIAPQAGTIRNFHSYRCFGPVRAEQDFGSEICNLCMNELAQRTRDFNGLHIILKACWQILFNWTASTWVQIYRTQVMDENGWQLADHRLRSSGQELRWRRSLGTRRHW